MTNDSAHQHHTGETSSEQQTATTTTKPIHQEEHSTIETVSQIDVNPSQEEYFDEEETNEPVLESLPNTLELTPVLLDNASFRDTMKHTVKDPVEMKQAHPSTLEGFTKFHDTKAEEQAAKEKNHYQEENNASQSQNEHHDNSEIHVSHHQQHHEEVQHHHHSKESVAQAHGEKAHFSNHDHQHEELKSDKGSESFQNHPSTNNDQGTTSSPSMLGEEAVLSHSEKEQNTPGGLPSHEIEANGNDNSIHHPHSKSEIIHQPESGDMDNHDEKIPINVSHHDAAPVSDQNLESPQIHQRLDEINNKEAHVAHEIHASKESVHNEEAQETIPEENNHFRNQDAHVQHVEKSPRTVHNDSQVQTVTLEENSHREHSTPREEISHSHSVSTQEEHEKRNSDATHHDPTHETTGEEPYMHHNTSINNDEAAENSSKDLQDKVPLEQHEKEHEEHVSKDELLETSLIHETPSSSHISEEMEVTTSVDETSIQHNLENEDKALISTERYDKLKETNDDIAQSGELKEEEKLGVEETPVQATQEQMEEATQQQEDDHVSDSHLVEHNSIDHARQLVEEPQEERTHHENLETTEEYEMHTPTENNFDEPRADTTANSTEIEPANAHHHHAPQHDTEEEAKHHHSTKDHINEETQAISKGENSFLDEQKEETMGHVNPPHEDEKRSHHHHVQEENDIAPSQDLALEEPQTEVHASHMIDESSNSIASPHEVSQQAHSLQDVPPVNEAKENEKSEHSAQHHAAQSQFEETTRIAETAEEYMEPQQDHKKETPYLHHHHNEHVDPEMNLHDIEQHPVPSSEKEVDAFQSEVLPTGDPEALEEKMPSSEHVMVIEQEQHHQSSASDSHTSTGHEEAHSHLHSEDTIQHVEEHHHPHHEHSHIHHEAKHHHDPHLQEIDTSEAHTTTGTGDELSTNTKHQDHHTHIKEDCTVHEHIVHNEDDHTHNHHHNHHHVEEHGSAPLDQHDASHAESHHHAQDSEEALLSHHAEHGSSLEHEHHREHEESGPIEQHSTTNINDHSTNSSELPETSTSTELERDLNKLHESQHNAEHQHHHHHHDHSEELHQHNHETHQEVQHQIQDQHHHEEPKDHHHEQHEQSSEAHVASHEHSHEEHGQSHPCDEKDHHHEHQEHSSKAVAHDETVVHEAAHHHHASEAHEHHQGEHHDHSLPSDNHHEHTHTVCEHENNTLHQHSENVDADHTSEANVHHHEESINTSISENASESHHERSVEQSKETMEELLHTENTETAVEKHDLHSDHHHEHDHTHQHHEEPVETSDETTPLELGSISQQIEASQELSMNEESTIVDEENIKPQIDDKQDQLTKEIIPVQSAEPGNDDTNSQETIERHIHDKENCNSTTHEEPHHHHHHHHHHHDSPKDESEEHNENAVTSPESSETSHAVDEEKEHQDTAEKSHHSEPHLSASQEHTTSCLHEDHYQEDQHPAEEQQHTADHVEEHHHTEHHETSSRDRFESHHASSEEKVHEQTQEETENLHKELLVQEAHERHHEEATEENQTQECAKKEPVDDESDHRVHDSNSFIHNEESTEVAEETFVEDAIENEQALEDEIQQPVDHLNHEEYALEEPNETQIDDEQGQNEQESSAALPIDVIETQQEEIHLDEEPKNTPIQEEEATVEALHEDYKQPPVDKLHHESVHAQSEEMDHHHEVKPTDEGETSQNELNVENFETKEPAAQLLETTQEESNEDLQEEANEIENYQLENEFENPFTEEEPTLTHISHSGAVEMQEEETETTVQPLEVTEDSMLHEENEFQDVVANEIEAISAAEEEHSTAHDRTVFEEEHKDTHDHVSHHESHHAHHEHHQDEHGQHQEPHSEEEPAETKEEFSDVHEESFDDKDFTIHPHETSFNSMDDFESGNHLSSEVAPTLEENEIAPHEAPTLENHSHTNGMMHVEQQETTTIHGGQHLDLEENETSKMEEQQAHESTFTSDPTVSREFENEFVDGKQETFEELKADAMQTGDEEVAKINDHKETPMDHHHQLHTGEAKTTDETASQVHRKEDSEKLMDHHHDHMTSVVHHDEATTAQHYKDAHHQTSDSRALDNTHKEDDFSEEFAEFEESATTQEAENVEIHHDDHHVEHNREEQKHVRFEEEHSVVHVHNSHDSLEEHHTTYHPYEELTHEQSKSISEPLTEESLPFTVVKESNHSQTVHNLQQQKEENENIQAMEETFEEEFEDFEIQKPVSEKDAPTVDNHTVSQNDSHASKESHSEKAVEVSSHHSPTVQHEEPSTSHTVATEASLEPVVEEQKPEPVKERTLEDVYIENCQKRDLRPNTRLRKQFADGSIVVDGEVNLFDNYLGDKGLEPFLETLLQLPFSKLSLPKQGLRNPAVQSLVEILKQHPTIVEIDLSDNLISIAGALALIDFAKSNPSIQKINVEGTYVDDIFKQKMEKYLVQHRPIVN
ncbi:hypothetical protein FDP41_009509 [Naegleria fowleri]|uniref:Uncharacterized protein n=1 Tax=Naegleria fowleri TaxID=5763 RepID=A0A6A5BBR0_NAEFO|nr:uncharacterized protein FDP41_009509 [Naegleria fowleri]KAF0972201.1 hypothetical protein FDP41_009509 [Naegleria fowleri]